MSVNKVFAFFAILLCVQVGRSDGVFRAAWIPVSYHTSSYDTVFETFHRLKDEGITRVYVDVWNEGIVYFSSPTMRALLGKDVGRDVLQWAAVAGEKVGIEVVAWFEYGLMACSSSFQNTSEFATVSQKKGWLMGEYEGFVWLDASNTEVKEFFLGIMEDALNGYNITGVQLDDHLGNPIPLGGSVSTMNDFIDSLSLQIKSSISLSPTSINISISKLGIDWPELASKGKFQEIIPQLYTESEADFLIALTEVYDRLEEKKGKALECWKGVGIRVVGSGPDTPWTCIEDMLSLTHRYGRNPVIWYATGVLDVYPIQFKQYWSTEIDAHNKDDSLI